MSFTTMPAFASSTVKTTSACFLLIPQSKTTAQERDFYFLPPTPTVAKLSFWRLIKIFIMEMWVVFLSTHVHGFSMPWKARYSLAFWGQQSSGSDLPECAVILARSPGESSGCLLARCDLQLDFHINNYLWTSVWFLPKTDRSFAVLH